MGVVFNQGVWSDFKEREDFKSLPDGCPNHWPLLWF